MLKKYLNANGVFNCFSYLSLEWWRIDNAFTWKLSLHCASFHERKQLYKPAICLHHNRSTSQYGPTICLDYYFF